MNQPETDKFLNDIAIIGMACRFPGARNIEEFWANLRAGIESISHFTEEELIDAGVEPGLLKNPNYIRANGYLQDLELFDATFFGFSPKEAAIIDPQQRIFLECAWEAMERAGYDAERYAGLIGVFAGVGKNNYLLNNLITNPQIIEAVGVIQTTLGNDKDFIPTQTSYKLNLKGPSVNVQSACSTSLVATHLACQSLLNGECDMAMAGGVSITEVSKQGYVYQKEGTYSSDGHCRPFDAKADGMVGGNGAGIIVMKRLADALRDRDTIHAVIKGSAINNDGSAKIGFTAPSVEGQSEVITEALAVADIDPGTVSYIETHGTATSLGDPIEIAALTQAFRNSTEAKGFCGIGSVKSNIGHTNAAAGVAGVIKTVLALKNREIPPSLHFEKANPEIDFDNSPFYVNAKLQEWRADTPRRAGVSSFGMGGTNAHLILEEAPVVEDKSSGASRPYQLILLSGRTEAALDITGKKLADFLKSEGTEKFADTAYTLALGRRPFNYRKFLVAQQGREASGVLKNAATEAKQGFFDGDEKKVVFMFPGQGAQYVNMGREIYENESVFRDTVDRCCEPLKPHLGLDLREIIYPDSVDAESARDKLKQTAITQPALFVIEYALARLLMSWGIRPQAMIGHSIGEYVAACLAGVFSLEDALLLVAERGRIMQSMPTGSMLAVPVSENDLNNLLPDNLSVAAINSPSLCVVSGDDSAIQAFGDQLSESGVEGRKLHTSHAFHSTMMADAAEAFSKVVSQINLKSNEIPFISSVTGDIISTEQATQSEYWASQIRESVRFASGITTLLNESQTVFLEVGPGTSLSGLVRQHPDARGRVIVNLMRHPRDEVSDEPVLLSGLGQLWLHGVDIDWYAFYEDQNRRRVELPTYPFERQRYWIEPTSADVHRPLDKSSDISKWFYQPSWKRKAISAASSKEETIILIADKLGIYNFLRDRLAEAGHHVIVAKTGEKYEEISEDMYTIKPGEETHFEQFYASLKSEGVVPDRLVYMPCLTAAFPGSGGKASVRTDIVNAAFYDLLPVIRTFAVANKNGAICLISNECFEVVGTESVCPEKSLLLGPCRVAPQEFQDLSCKLMDIELSDKGELISDIDSLTAEIREDTSDSVVAFRGRHRWVQDLDAIDFQKPQGTTLRPNGVYLITGGTGGIGLALAAHLASSVKAKLILLGRSSLPEKNNWKEVVSDKTSPTQLRRRIEKMQAWEASGAEVLYLQADVTNLQDLKKAVSQGKKHFGAINGVIHCAGVPGGGIIELKERESAEQILAPKVFGARNLESCFQGAELDFMVLCSSLSSLIGGYGQVDYCAANAFMDAFALGRSNAGKPFTASISWDAWKESGMAVDTNAPEQVRKLREENLQYGLTDAEGAEVFIRALGGRQAHVYISTRDLKRRLASRVDDLTQESTADDSGDIATFSRPGLSNAYVEPASEIEKDVAQVWQKLFGIDKIGVEDDFFELGGHSLLATQLLNKLRQQYPSTDLSLRALFDHPTIRKISGLIEGAGDEQTADSDLTKRILSEPEERESLISAYLEQRTAHALALDSIDTASDLNFEAIAGDLIWDLKKDFSLRIYPYELSEKSSIPEMSRFLSEQLNRLDKLQSEQYTEKSEISFERAGVPGIMSEKGSKNPGMVFILSAPRSGSTLLRLMLSGHSALFCPPELGLLSCDNAIAWHTTLRNLFSDDGAVRVFMEITGMSRSNAETFFMKLKDDNPSIREIYALVQKHAQPKTLVDKTPAYALDMANLIKAETFFEKPKYIHLIRHPYSVMDSFVRNRFERLLQGPENEPYGFAEYVWTSCNANIADFFAAIEPKRCYTLTYEELVRRPKEQMHAICDFLGLSYEKALIDPYGNGKMVAGPGDPDVLQHDRIDPDLAEVWKNIRLPRTLHASSKGLAKKYGYALPGQADSEDLDDRNIDDEVRQNVDKMSDSEVDALLQKMLSDDS